MAIGDTFQGQFTSFIDPEFGYTIIRPIEDDGNRILYFTSNCFCKDNRNMLITAVRGDSEQFYLLDYTTGVYTQLTDEPGIDIAHGYFDKKHERLYYTNGQTIKSTCIRTLEKKIVYESPFPLYSLAVTCDGRYVISSYTFPYEHSNNDGEIRQFELCRMFRVDLETGEWKRILDRNFEIDHIQCNPIDPDQIMYCARGYFSTHQRIWHTNLEGTAGGPLGPEQPNEHRTHEYFTPDGLSVAYHGKFSKINDKNRFTNIGHSWGMMNKDGSSDKYYLSTNGMQAGHSSMSYAGTMIVADGNDYLSLLELDDTNGELRFNQIFAHRSSMRKNFVHPHPCFSHDDRYIAFCTDREGADRGNIYLLDLHSKTK